MKLSVISDQISSSFEEAFQTAADYGYEYVELHNAWNKTIEELNASETAEIKRLLKNYHLSVSNIASTVFFVCPLYERDHVTGFNDSFHVIEGGIEEHLKYLERACQIANELESPNIRLFPFRFPDNRKPPFGDVQDAQHIKAAFLKASDIAQPYGVKLAVENCPYSHLPKGEMTLELIRRVNRDNVKLLYDPANSYRAVKENVPRQYAGWELLYETSQVVSETRHMHVKDYHYDPSVQPKPFLHVVTGTGDIDYPGIFGIMKAHGCACACSLEPEVTAEGALQSTDWLREIL